MSSIARTAATGGALDPEFLAWSTSLPVDKRLLALDCQGSIAHVQALEAAGFLEPEEARALAEALGRLPALVERGEVALPDEEDVHMAVESWLRATVGEVADKLHTGRSRNDQVATDFALWARAAVADLENGLAAVAEQVRRWSEHQGEVVIPAFTHRQVAVPVYARLWLEGALGLPLQRDHRVLDVVAAELEDCPLGAGAVGGSTLAIDPTIAARALGFPHGPRNPLDHVGARDFAVTLVFACSRIGLHLQRFCADLIELVSDGLFVLDGAIAGGSSMMPHKKNPDLFELVRGQAALRYGELVAMFSTFQGLGSGYHRDLQQDKQIAFAAVDGTLACLRMVEIAVPNMRPEPQACLRALERGDAIATDLCEALVETGMSFRASYRAVGALVAQQRSAGKRLMDLAPEDFERARLPRELHARLDLAESAERRARRFERG